MQILFDAARSGHRDAGFRYALLIGLSITSVVAQAQPGDLTLRIGIAHVAAQGDSDEITALGPGAQVEADSGTSLGLTLSYMLGQQLGVGVLAAWPFEHDIEATGSIAGLGKVAETKQLPPTLTLQWHFSPDAKLRPYVGAGVNYTRFFSEATQGALAASSLSLDDSWGLAGELGIDVDLNSQWFVSAQLWYLDIDTEATVSGVGRFDVEIDPWVLMLGLGTQF